MIAYQRVVLTTCVDEVPAPRRLPPTGVRGAIKASLVRPSKTLDSATAHLTMIAGAELVHSGHAWPRSENLCCGWLTRLWPRTPPTATKRSSRGWSSSWSSGISPDRIPLWRFVHRGSTRRHRGSNWQGGRRRRSSQAEADTAQKWPSPHTVRQAHEVAPISGFTAHFIDRAALVA